MEVCQKALDRIEKIRTAERDLNECRKYHICPKCGEDMEIKSTLTTVNGLQIGVCLFCNSCGFIDTTLQSIS